MEYGYNNVTDRRRFEPLPTGFEPIDYLFRRPLITGIDVAHAARRDISSVVEQIKMDKGYGWMPAPQQLPYKEGKETESYLEQTTPRMTEQQFRNYSFIS